MPKNKKLIAPFVNNMETNGDIKTVKDKNFLKETDNYIVVESRDGQCAEIYKKPIEGNVFENSLYVKSLDTDIKVLQNELKSLENEQFKNDVIDFETKYLELGNKILINKSYTRADIIHAYTAGHHDGRFGITHANGLSAYREQQKL